jgi:hypothetical protein
MLNVQPVVEAGAVHELYRVVKSALELINRSARQSVLLLNGD